MGSMAEVGPFFHKYQNNAFSVSQDQWKLTFTGFTATDANCLEIGCTFSGAGQWLSSVH
jgi:hypothetical protein